MHTLTCSNIDCENTFEELKSVVPDAIPGPGDLLLCGQCGTINVVLPRSIGLRPITAIELSALSETEQKDLDFAVRNIKARHARRS